MTPAERERARLAAFPAALDGVAGAAIDDLDATPGAAWGVRFLGEFFYGATAAEAVAKAVDFAADVGEDLAGLGAFLDAKAWPIGAP